MLYKKKWPLVVFLVPGLLFMLVFLYIPFVENIGNSFYDMTSIIQMPGKDSRITNGCLVTRMCTQLCSTLQK